MLIRKVDSKKWLSIDKAPLNLRNNLERISNKIVDDIDYRIIRLHMVNGELVVTGYHPIENSFSCSIYKDKDFYDYCSNILDIVSKLNKPIKEIYWFVYGRYSNVRVRKNFDGEYSMVIG